MASFLYHKQIHITTYGCHHRGPYVIEDPQIAVTIGQPIIIGMQLIQE